MASQDEQQEQQPVYFWRETDPQTGWLSQWCYCPFRDDEDPSVVYDTAEQCVYSFPLLSASPLPGPSTCVHRS